jgi:hypothetical protein
MAVVVLAISIVLIAVARFIAAVLCARAPVDESRGEVREAENRAEVRAVGVHLVQAESAVVLESEHEPAPSGEQVPTKALTCPPW